MAMAPQRALYEPGPDVVPCRAQPSFCYVVSHGWLAVGHPALRDRHCRGSDIAQCAYPSAYALKGGRVTNSN